MSTLPKKYLTEEEYLEIERKAEYKSEYFAGEMFAMSGAREPHVLITGNAFRELSQQLRHRACKVYSADMRVRVTPSGLYTYPDVAVVYREPRFIDDNRETLLNPTLIIEVLSESTEAYDRGQKFEFFRSVESLSEYLMISSLRVSAELYRRGPEGLWTLNAKSSLEDSIDLPSIDCRLALADVYEKVEFRQSPPLMRPLPS